MRSWESFVESRTLLKGITRAPSPSCRQATLSPSFSRQTAVTQSATRMWDSLLSTRHEVSALSDCLSASLTRLHSLTTEPSPLTRFISDIDECSAPDPEDGSEPLCSQICLNTLGSYICSCYHGFRLRSDQRTCVCEYCARAVKLSTLSDLLSLSFQPF